MNTPLRSLSLVTSILFTAVLLVLSSQQVFAETVPTPSQFIESPQYISYTANGTFEPSGGYMKEGSALSFYNDSGKAMQLRFDLPGQSQGQSISLTGRIEYKPAFLTELPANTFVTFCDKSSYYQKPNFALTCTALNVPKGSFTILSSADYDAKKALAMFCVSGPVPQKACKSPADCIGRGFGYTGACDGRVIKFCGQKDYYTLCNVKRPSPPPPVVPTLALHITTPKPFVVTDNDRSLEAVSIKPGDSVRVLWSSQNASFCNFVSRKVLRGTQWVEGEIVSQRIYIGPNEGEQYIFFGMEGDKDDETLNLGNTGGNALVHPKESVEYNLQCSKDGLKSETKGIRILFNTTTPPTFSNFKNTTGVRALDLAQYFTFDLSGDGTVTKPTLDSSCAKDGGVNQTDNGSNSYKHTYEVIIVPKTITRTCTLTAKSQNNGLAVSYPFSLQAYPIPKIAFAPYPGDIWAPSGDVKGNVSITEGDKVNLSWGIYLADQPPGVSVTLDDGTGEKPLGGNNDNTLIRGNKEVAPIASTTYTLSATNRYGIARSVSRTVTVQTQLQKYGVTTESDFPRHQECTTIKESKKTDCSGVAGGGAVVGGVGGVAACFGFGIIPACLAAGGGVLSLITGGACVLACAVGGAVTGGVVAGGGCALLQSSNSCRWITDYPPGYRAITSAPTLTENLGGLSQSVSLHWVITNMSEIIKVIPDKIEEGFKVAGKDIFGTSYVRSTADVACSTNRKRWAPGDPVVKHESSCSDPVPYVPTYHQYDPQWANRPFSCSNIGADGCGTTALAIVMDYWMRRTHNTPDQSHITPIDTARAVTDARFVLTPIECVKSFIAHAGTFADAFTSQDVFNKLPGSFVGKRMYFIEPNDWRGPILDKAIAPADKTIAITEIIGYLSRPIPSPILVAMIGFPADKVIAGSAREGYSRCSPGSPFTGTGHALVLTGYKKVNGEGIFTVSDPGSTARYCFYRFYRDASVVEEWTGEIPEIVLYQYMMAAYYVHPASVQ